MEEVQRRRHSIKAVRSLLLHVEDGLLRVREFYAPTPSSLGSVPMKSVADSIWHDLKHVAEMLHEIPVTALSPEMVRHMISIRDIANYGEFLGGDGSGLSVRDMDLFFVKNELRNKFRLVEGIKKDLDKMENELGGNF